MDGKRPPKKQGRRKQRRKRPDRRGGATGKGPPATPVLKVTVRNVTDMEKCGSARKMADMLVSIIQRANATTSKKFDSIQLVVEEMQLQQLLDGDEAAEKAALEWKKQQEEIEQEEDVTEQEENDGDRNESADDEEASFRERKGACEEMKEGETSYAKATSAKTGDDNSVLSIQKGAIFTRIMYMVPPYLTKRRGIKPGRAYLVLTAPPIETLPSVQEPPFIRDTLADTSGMTPQQNGEETSTVFREGEAVEMGPLEQKPVPPTSAVDYSRDIAKRRLFLEHALESLISASAGTDLVVEESLNSKTWRVTTFSKDKTQYHDRMEGTVQETMDYQQFLEKVAKQKEERIARPKPAPGGRSIVAGTATSNDTVDQPVSALVLHLQKKQQEQKRKKQARRKAKDAKRKQQQHTGNVGSEDNKLNGKKKRKNKKKGPINANAAPGGAG
jgi:hypothetical protein